MSVLAPPTWLPAHRESCQSAYMRQLQSRMRNDALLLDGFGCSECDWFYLVEIERLNQEPPPAISAVVRAFNTHDCREFPRAA